MIAWTGTVANILGSFLVAFGVLFWGYLLFMLGSACWIYCAIRSNDRALLTLNHFFLAANVIGLYRNF